MKALIIDDERLARQELKSLLAEHKDIEIIGECSNAEDAKEKINLLKPDVLFLDIQMPGKTGLELIEEISGLPEVIFVTAYDEFALRAFEVNALDYLLKPVSKDRLNDALKKLFAKEDKDGKKENSTPFLDEDMVFVKDGDKCWFVKLSNIRLFESEGNYVRVLFDNHRPLILRSLNNLDTRLNPKTFFRASRKHIINLKWIENIETWFNGGLMVKLKAGEQVEISRRQAVKLKDMMSL
jgi:two-component system LytT family response regulator